MRDQPNTIALWGVPRGGWSVIDWLWCDKWYVIVIIKDIGGCHIGHGSDVGGGMSVCEGGCRGLTGSVGGTRRASASEDVGDAERCA